MIKALYTLTVAVLCYSLHAFAKECQYHMDGVDDSINFNIGSLESHKTFTITTWFKNTRKEKNSHIDQTIFALRNTNSGDKIGLMWMSDSKIRLDLATQNSVCDLDIPLLTERWYHIAVTGGMGENVKIWLNGIDMRVSCFRDKGSVTEIITTGRNINMEQLVASSALYVGANIPGSAEQNCFFKGSIANFHYYQEKLDGNTIYQEMFSVHDDDRERDHHSSLTVKQSLSAPCDGTVNTHPEEQRSEYNRHLSALRAQTQKMKKPLPGRRTTTSADFAAMLHINGSPELKNLNFGDSYLSAMLSVLEAKLSFYDMWENAASVPHDFADFFLLHFGQISQLVPDKKGLLLQLRDSLVRHFQVLVDEEYVWRSYNEYAVRLEMLGHSVALLMKQHQQQRSGATENNGTAHTDSLLKADSKKKPMIGIIAPATSKGIDPNKLSHLAIAISLLPSLYATRSRDYDYRVYISANENDAIFSNDVLLTALFDGIYVRAKEEFYKTLDSTSINVSFPKIHHRLVVVPSSMIPKRALSALFNIPTLLAYEDGCDYFYIGNDDLQFKSQGWTELLVDPLRNNPVYSGLGVSGGIDISDSITPQIEFPFFHRTHVELFPWCGTNPWIFKNWWEDNWLTDIYLPFESVFYQKGVIVENYVGLESNEVVKPVEVRAADPRYEVVEGRRTPPFYVEEVEKGRDRILNFLQHGQIASNGVEGICETRDFNMNHGKHQRSIDPEASEQKPYVGVTNMSYCYEPDKRVPTLTSMPIHTHEEALDPCNAGIAEGSSLKEYRHHVHAKELPHASYAPMVPCVGPESNMRKNHAVKEYYGKVRSIDDSCRKFYSSQSESKLLQTESMRVTQMDDDTYEMWMGCMSKIGLGYEKSAQALSRGELCRRDFATGSDKSPYASCKMTVPLNILILHNHCPLFTRYGSDKRLYHIAETLVGLGHRVNFGGSFKSDLESDDDHRRLQNIGAKLYSPLATRTDDGTVMVQRDVYEQLLRSLKPDFVLMTMWFWNIPPASELYFGITRRELPASARIGVLSDDAHAYREELLLKTAGDAGRAIGEGDISRVGYVRRSETSSYFKSDVIMTITEEDKVKMNSRSVSLDSVTRDHSAIGTKRIQMERKIQQQASSKTKLNMDKFQVVRYALSPTEILSDDDSRLKGRAGNNVDGSNRAHLCFVGNGANPTNQQALQWFFSEIYPLIFTVDPEIRVVVIGADWEHLAEDFPQYKDFSLIIRGILSQDDMTAAMLDTKVFISPIVASTGLNTKNLLALSRGLPMVTTEDGSHGLKYSRADYPSSKIPPFFVASSAREFADMVLKLYKDNALWRETVLASLLHARTEFGLQAQAHEIEKAIQIAFSSGAGIAR